MATQVSLPDVSEIPHQPLKYSFPRHEFGQKNVVSCSFQGSWFNKWKWLHYDESRDLVFCHVYVTGVKSGELRLTGYAN